MWSLRDICAALIGRNVVYAENDQPETPADAPYEKPTLTRLGTLGELTLGGTDDFSDGVGGAGEAGSI